MEALEATLPKIHTVPLQVDEEESNVEYIEQVAIPECYYPQYEKVVIEGKTCKANNFNIRHSVYKLATMAKVVNGKHIYDAQNILNQVPKKSAQVLNTMINAARKNGVQDGLNE